MLTRLMKISIAIVLSLMFTVSLLKLVLFLWNAHPFWHFVQGIQEEPLPTVDQWLEELNLTQYSELFRSKGKCI